MTSPSTIGVWVYLTSVLVAGGLGGMVNAFVADEGFALPRKVASNGRVVLRLGALGNILVGCLAGCVSTILASSFSTDMQVPQLLLACANSLLVGVSGARWLTNHADKQLLRAATEQALSKPPAVTPPDLKTLMSSSPARILDFVQNAH